MERHHFLKSYIILHNMVLHVWNMLLRHWPVSKQKLDCCTLPAVSYLLVCEITIVSANEHQKTAYSCWSYGQCVS